MEIRSEQHGGHWIAWVADADGKPRQAVILVGQTQDEAEKRAQAWASALTSESHRS